MHTYLLLLTYTQQKILHLFPQLGSDRVETTTCVLCEMFGHVQLRFLIYIARNTVIVNAHNHIDWVPNIMYNLY